MNSNFLELNAFTSKPCMGPKGSSHNLTDLRNIAKELNIPNISYDPKEMLCKKIEYYFDNINNKSHEEIVVDILKMSNEKQVINIDQIIANPELLKTFTAMKLQAVAKQLGIKPYGTKEALVYKIQQYLLNKNYNIPAEQLVKLKPTPTEPNKFFEKTCHIQRQGWSVDQLKDMARQLNLNVAGLTKKEQLCFVLQKYFESKGYTVPDNHKFNLSSLAQIGMRQNQNISFNSEMSSPISSPASPMSSLMNQNEMQVSPMPPPRRKNMYSLDKNEELQTLPTPPPRQVKTYETPVKSPEQNNENNNSSEEDVNYSDIISNYSDDADENQNLISSNSSSPLEYTPPPVFTEEDEEDIIKF